MIHPLKQLQSRLELAFSQPPGLSEDWQEPDVLGRMLEQVRQKHDRPEGKRVSRKTIAKAVTAFRETGSLLRFRDLKYVCLGAASIDLNDSRDCLLGEEQLLKLILHLAETLPEARRQLKCFQALLHSYWSFPLHHPDLTEAAVSGLAAFRDWLARRLIALDSLDIHKPAWFVTLSQHAHLLTEQACLSYVAGLLEGDGSALQHAVDELAIPVDSWVIEEAMLAAIGALVALKDDDFIQRLPQILTVSTGQTALFVPRTLVVRCIARMLTRYARCAKVSEQAELFGMALSVLGNPWLRRATWEVQVRDDHGWPDELARVMVSAWLKRRLISDFFELYCQSDAARRLAYWLRFDPFIDDLWLAIKPPSESRDAMRFGTCRRLAKGRLLEPNEEAGAALYMRIGDFVAMEFAATEQAALLFRWDSLTPEQAMLLGLGNTKNRAALPCPLPIQIEARLAHIDNPATGSKWEQKFDECIRPIIWRVS